MGADLGGVPGTLQTVLAFAAFVVPGFVLRSGYVRSRSASASESALYVLAEAVTGSMMVLAVAWWFEGREVLTRAEHGTLAADQREAYWFFLGILAAPYLAGLIVGWLVNGLHSLWIALKPDKAKHPWLHTLYYYYRLEIGGLFSSPTLWDEVWETMPKQDGKILLRVRTTWDDEYVGAIEHRTWADNSPRPHDLILARLYDPDGSGGWRPREGHEGMYLPAASIASLEFFRAATS